MGSFSDLIQQGTAHAWLFIPSAILLGATLVLCFSIGLAVVMVSAGVAAALGMRHAERRWSGLFDTVARRTPYGSVALILLVGLYMAWHGWNGLPPGGI